MGWEKFFLCEPFRSFLFLLHLVKRKCWPISTLCLKINYHFYQSSTLLTQPMSFPHIGGCSVRKPLMEAVLVSRNRFYRAELGVHE